mmetsp:Transcript_19579/g.45947  ORF Transcript_19579/g.45947 Transcript_19579/m.45947 type:complete len:277 (-) Transcript_19579:1702-2532(-)
MPNVELSPNTMATRAFDDAVAVLQSNAEREGPPSQEDGGDSGDKIIDSDNKVDAIARIQQLWKTSANADADARSAAVTETLALISGEVDSLVQSGLGAFYDLDSASRQLAQTREIAEARGREAQRLHASEEQSRSSLSNLLRAVEGSKAGARESSRSAQIEARLRAEINSLRDDRDRVVQESVQFRRKLSLLEEENRLTKSKLSKTMSEKLSLERDSRAALSLARSLDSNNHSDLSYYKRKCSDMGDRDKAQQQEIADLRGQLAALQQAQKKRKSY